MVLILELRCHSSYIHPAIYLVESWGSRVRNNRTHSTELAESSEAMVTTLGYPLSSQLHVWQRIKSPGEYYYLCSHVQSWWEATDFHVAPLGAVYLSSWSSHLNLKGPRRLPQYPWSYRKTSVSFSPFTIEARNLVLLAFKLSRCSQGYRVLVAV